MLYPLSYEGVKKWSDLGFRFSGYLTRTSTTVESTKLVGDTSTKLNNPHQYRSGACDPKVIGPLLAPAPVRGRPPGALWVGTPPSAGR